MPNVRSSSARGAALCLCLYLLAGPRADAQETVRIQSVAPADTLIPIAVPPFAATPNAGRYAQELATIISNDLEFSGLFTIVTRDRYPKRFRGFNADAGRINFETWRASPAGHLVHGFVALQGDRLVAECRLFDVLVAQQVVGKRLQSEAKWSRLLAHQFADEIIRFLTGLEGVASSEITFSAGQTGKKEIYVADYDAGTVTQVTGHGSISIKPRFSPDGQRIAYLSYKDGYPFLYVYDRRTGVSTSLSKRSGLNHSPGWAPDGKTLAICLSKDGNTEIYLKNADGTGEQRLTNNRVGDTSPVFSPDGTRIAFVSDRTGRAQIFSMSARGTDVRRLSYQGGSGYDPAWSSDGRYIAYVVERPGDGLEIYMMDADGGNARRLTDSRGGSESPSWSPDSRHIMFTSTRSGGPQLYTITIETGVVRRVPRLAHLRSQGPSWGPRRH